MLRFEKSKQKAHLFDVLYIYNIHERLLGYEGTAKQGVLKAPNEARLFCSAAIWF